MDPLSLLWRFWRPYRVTNAAFLSFGVFVLACGGKSRSESVPGNFDSWLQYHCEAASRSKCFLMGTVEDCRAIYQSQLQYAERDGCGAEYREAATCIFRNGFFCRTETLMAWNEGCDAEWLGQRVYTLT